MQISGSVATFSKPEVKVLHQVMKVQDYVKSNSAGDQKHLDTPGITNLADINDAIQKDNKLDLNNRQDLDTPDYAHALINYVNTFAVYASSMNTYTPQIDKVCKSIVSQLKDYLKSAKK
ncbi:hypothetical protein [Acetilactobacillus jinshanensis]|uniref:Uncharacterized protein n=1 Tax=Acetilactobacillus jinshanensis TaxID=1720083 RepID=A0A4P6ZL94_9LACO|nr:hypothetical protein [Acetilactobacillus jinshanensis]QBP18504.1 hypothetical protein ELX58_05020 [Acetilactobacillus jinshanensis]URL61375.1 hypothetical protein HGK75_05135 [uncultured bacterium]